MSPSERYSRTAIVLHWLIALAVRCNVAGAMKHLLWDRDGLAARMRLGRARDAPA